MARRPGSGAGGWLATVLVCVATALPPAARAQVVRGTVIDSETSHPVVLAYVGLMVPGRQLVVAGLADAAGRFQVRAPRAGSYFLYVARTGYKPIIDGLFELGDDGVMEVQIGMTPQPIPLDSLRVDVEGTRQHDLNAVGFFERQEMGIGTFLQREDIQRHAIDDITDAFWGIPQFMVITPTVNLLVPTQVLNPEVRVRRGAESCSPTLFVDGVVMAMGSAAMDPRRTAVRPGDFVDPAEVEGVEIYTGPAETPPMYERTSGCGALLIWTRKR